MLGNQQVTNCLYFWCTVVHRQECVFAKVGHFLQWRHAKISCLDTKNKILWFQASIKNKTFASQFRSFVDQDLNGSLDLKQSFQKMSSSPEGFFYLRNNFLSSHGTSSLVSWIMSIGDRHADNLLISKVSGESIPIDFGHAFGSAFFLPIPELGKHTQPLKQPFWIIQKFSLVKLYRRRILTLNAQNPDSSEYHYF